MPCWNVSIRASVIREEIPSPASTAALLTVTILVISVAFAKIGIIDLIAKGYNALAYAFILLYLVPLLTVGVYKIMKKSPKKEEETAAGMEMVK